MYECARVLYERSVSVNHHSKSARANCIANGLVSCGYASTKRLRGTAVTHTSLHFAPAAYSTMLIQCPRPRSPAPLPALLPLAALLRLRLAAHGRCSRRRGCSRSRGGGGGTGGLVRCQLGQRHERSARTAAQRTPCTLQHGVPLKLGERAAPPRNARRRGSARDFAVAAGRPGLRAAPPGRGTHRAGGRHGIRRCARNGRGSRHISVIKLRTERARHLGTGRDGVKTLDSSVSQPWRADSNWSTNKQRTS